jgi:predicted transglutaminase-like cysteine proteinase
MTGEAHHRCLEAGWSELEGIGAARLFTFAVRPGGGLHTVLKVVTRSGDQIEVCVSPKGRNTTVHVNGVAS